MVLAHTSIRKPLAIIMVILAFVLFGIYSFTRLPVDLMPEMDLPYVTVQAIYPGAGPQEIETSVVKPVEEQMTTIAGLKNVTSYCMEGVSFIVLEFDMSIDADMAAIEVKDKIDAILYHLPDDLERPVIGKFDPNDEPIMRVALIGPASSEQLRRMADQQIKDRLARITGVANIEVQGGKQREIQVNLRKEKMDAHNLSIFQVYPLIQAQSANFPAGQVTGAFREYTVRVQGEFTSVDDIANIKIPAMKMGREPVQYTVLLSEIADVIDSHEEVREKARFQGKEAVNFAIQKRPDANTMDVAKSVVEQIQLINSNLADGFALQVAQDNSTFIRDSVNDTYSSMALGIILTSLILLLFLYDWKLMLIAAITMPASVIMAFVAMEAAGFSLNIVTLMALSISVGILVTNAIIVLENIVRVRNKGLPVKRAAEIGTGEIAVAVLASALTNLAVFLPIATTGGITGSIFRALGLTIVFATLASLLLSFTLTPLMASRMLSGRNTHGNKDHLIERLMKKVQNSYGRLLHSLVYSKVKIGMALIFTVFLFAFSLFVVAPRIGSEFMAQGDQGYMIIDLELPPGTPLHQTDRLMSVLEERTRKLPEVESIVTSIGGSGVNTGVYYGQIIARFVGTSERKRSTEEVISEFRAQLVDLPDARIFVYPMKTMGGPGEADIQIEVTGTDLNTILSLTDSVRVKMKEVQGLTDIKLSWKGNKPEIQIIPDRERLEHYGLSSNTAASLTVQALGGMMRFSMTGNDQALFREADEDYPIRVQIAKQDRNTIREIEDMTIPTQKGMVPIKSVADIIFADGEASIMRKNRQRMVTVMANVSGGSTGEKTAELKKKFSSIPLDADYSIGFGGDQDMMQESNQQLMIAGLLAVILTYMVLAAILESLLMALVIWLTLPLGLIGVIWALFLTGNTFSMISNMSIIMLVGIVVNNAILLIDYARQLRREQGLSSRDAIIEAGKTKIKAILMMNLAIVLAMLPQALAFGSGGQIRAPFAITAIGGVLVSTALTFFIIPALYVITERKKMKSQQN
ncbi:MAG: efflux RND transporter permease subunit [Fibrobacterota bacterium]